MNVDQNMSCGICAKTFPNEGNLFKHIKSIHTAEKKHKCMQCNFSTNALCVFGKRGPKMFNFELLFLHGFSSKNREILHKAVLTPQEYEDYFFRKKN